MTIQTKPVFYYVEPVTKDNNVINFVEPNIAPVELTAELLVGTRSPEELATEVSRALNDAGLQTYTVTFNRADRTLEIASDDTFELLFNSGTNVGLSVHPLLGFDTTDLTGQTSYIGQSPLGVEYLPQFIPQRFKDFQNNLEGIQTSINESASGTVEVVTFGDRRFMEMELTYITDRFKVKGHPISNNPNAVAEARSFLEFCITKSNLEFMIDRADRNTFETVLLERTRQDRNGTSYELTELLSQNLEGYFTTGLLVFRRVVV